MNQRMRRYAGRFFLALLLLLVAGFLLPQRLRMPVHGAARGSYAQDSFWAYPWGESVTHKGVDIFARRGTPVEAATGGLVLYSGTNRLGGRVVLVLGPKWRTHYYAHLDSVYVGSLSFVRSGRVLGTVGASGNAKGKPPHLHYSIKTLLPYPWQNDQGRQGSRKMFYVNPVPLLNEALARR